MPLYHFHVHDGANEPDTEGAEMPNDAAARAEALKLAGEIIRDAGIRGCFSGELRIAVTDAIGTTLFRMEFSVKDTPDEAGEGLQG